MKNTYVFLAAILLLSCKAQQPDSIAVTRSRNDCRIVSGEFDEKPYAVGTKVEPMFRAFEGEVQDGVFFVMRNFSNPGGDRAFTIDTGKGEKWVYTASGTAKSILRSDEGARIRFLAAQVEKGSHRQVCLGLASEGSMSVLLVKSDGKVVCKYEAGQYDYRYLNGPEKPRIKNALELIGFLMDKG
ncbi:hypothetical protein TH61_05320 [Rufibacter sp. DG15C]|uniref:hypothetical protein n=1 Tax=Rufibacter sp. DG15C TaxID=1379909 RepID=UPI00078DE86D|nr:hypothetical protein [Rufibacter sp. DG15C]AMM50712.1 hypothetical protein TH61_05320 [Rufibacter sp. DG15C]